MLDEKNYLSSFLEFLVNFVGFKILKPLILLYSALVQHENNISMFEMLDGVRYDDSRFLAEMTANSILHDFLGDVHVEGTQRIIH